MVTGLVQSQLTCGIPQGSIISLLFFIYINDLLIA